MNDLMRLEALYETLGIKTVTAIDIERKPLMIFTEKTDYEKTHKIFTAIEFDTNGKYIKQGFWENS